jgi:hypothetical protein
MGLIVHLTDLHLGERGAARPADDAKVRLIPDQERTTVRDVALRHLKKLAKGIRDNGSTISALVLGGDFTVGALPGGYADLKPFLEDCFGDLLPKPPRIVATPGNHDVKWYATDPAERYEQFIEHCVKAGYVTPPLDGIDLKAAARRWKPKAGNVLVNPEEGWFIVPLNTSNWSGTTAALVGADGKPIAEAEFDALRTQLQRNPAKLRVFEALAKFRQFDMPRVSKAQLQAFEDSIAFARSQLTGGSPGLAIAVMHHQLSPVNEREEIKPFESVSNLGRVRAALEEGRIGVALHGHKHDQLTMWNTVERGSYDGRASARHEMLVVSGGTIGGGDATIPGRFATLLDIEATAAGHEISIMHAKGYPDGGADRTRAYFVAGRRFEPLADLGGHIQAQTFDDAYAQLLFQGDVVDKEPINNVSVTVTDLGSVSGPPAGYPADATGGSAIVPLDQWFHEVASWWQSELVEAPRGLFTHGRRLKLHRGEKGADQIAAMVEILDGPRRRGNGRAIATLIDAETDILGKGKGGPATFPAFCLLQLHVRPEGGRTLLDATAYFRKQEMRYWWPVNVAEIKLVMERVLTKMKDAELGAITTVAAVAAWQGIRSRVSIPYVDRLYLRDAAGREQLMEMAAVLGQQSFQGGTPTDLDRFRSLWELALDDVVPPENAVDDSIPIAVEGVRFLRQAVAAQGAAASDEALRKRLREAADHLGTLERNGEDLWELGRQPRDGRFQDKLARGVGTMTEARERLRAIIQEALPLAGPAADTKSGATS